MRGIGLRVTRYLSSARAVSMRILLCEVRQGRRDGRTFLCDQGRPTSLTFVEPTAQVFLRTRLQPTPIFVQENRTAVRLVELIPLGAATAGRMCRVGETGLLTSLQRLRITHIYSRFRGRAPGWLGEEFGGLQEGQRREAKVLMY